MESVWWSPNNLIQLFAFPIFHAMYSGLAIHRSNDLLKNIVQNLGVGEQNLPEPMTRVQQGVGCHSSTAPVLVASSEWLIVMRE